jgi:hypothetical protein
LSGSFNGSARFAELQARLSDMFANEPEPGRTRTLVVIPSFTVDSDLLFRGPELQYWSIACCTCLPASEILLCGSSM